MPANTLDAGDPKAEQRKKNNLALTSHGTYFQVITSYIQDNHQYKLMNKIIFNSYKYYKENKTMMWYDKKIRAGGNLTLKAT